MLGFMVPCVAWTKACCASGKPCPPTPAPFHAMFPLSSVAPPPGENPVGFPLKSPDIAKYARIRFPPLASLFDVGVNEPQARFGADALAWLEPLAEPDVAMVHHSE